MTKMKSGNVLLVPCGKEKHRIQLEVGRLTLLDHPNWSGDRLRHLFGHQPRGCYKLLAILSLAPTECTAWGLPWITKNFRLSDSQVTILTLWLSMNSQVAIPLEHTDAAGVMILPFLHLDDTGCVAQLAIGVVDTQKVIQFYDGKFWPVVIKQHLSNALGSDPIGRALFLYDCDNACWRMTDAVSGQERPRCRAALAEVNDLSTLKDLRQHPYVFPSKSDAARAR